MPKHENHIQDIVDYFNTHGAEATIEKYGISNKTLSNYRSIYVKQEKEHVEGIQDTTHNIAGGTIAMDIIVKNKFKTVDEMTEYCELDKSVWEAVKVVSGNHTVPVKLKQKHTDKDGKVYYTDKLTIVHCYKYSVVFSRIKKVNTAVALHAYEKLVETYTPKVYVPKQHTNGSILVEPSIADPHIGRLSWGKETGKGDYDLHIACERYIDTHLQFRERVRNMNIGKVLLVFGNDFFNVNGSDNKTQHGTPQDEDGRWQKSYEMGLQVAVDTIELWREVAEVDVQTCFGNHDIERSYYLGANLKAYYRNHDDVTINNTPTMVKFYKWGKTLLAFTHKVKEKDVANLFLADACELLAGVTYKEMHAAHIHQERTVSEIGDVVTRFLPSMAELGAWEASEHFRGHPTSLCNIYDYDNGLDSIIYRRYNS